MTMTNNINDHAVVSEFINIREIIKTTIVNKEEVSSLTKIQKSGIYMVYIDNFEDEKIIPIYIGKTTDIQRRYKQHYCELLSLNRLSFEEYKRYNDSGIYDGSFKSCKIYKYMIDHNCDLSQYHFIVLEECSEKDLDSAEQYYIKKFKSEYFGFNQLNLKTMFPTHIHYNSSNDLNLYRTYVEAFKVNCNEIIKYINFGYTRFNYEYAFPTGAITARFANEEGKKIIEELIEYIDKTSQLINSQIYKRKADIMKIRE